MVLGVSSRVSFFLFLFFSSSTFSLFSFSSFFMVGNFSSNISISALCPCVAHVWSLRKAMSWEEQGSPHIFLYVGLKTYLTKALLSLPFRDTSVTNGSGQRMPRKALSWYLSKQERKEKEVLCSINHFFSIHCIINIENHFKEVYKLFFPLKFLPLFPSIELWQNIYLKLLFSLLK